MKKEQHLQALRKNLDKLYELAKLKGATYATDNDGLSNYLAGEAIGVNREDYMFSRSLEKIERLKILWKEAKETDNIQDIQEELGDIACILLHLKTLIG